MTNIEIFLHNFNIRFNFPQEVHTIFKDTVKMMVQVLVKELKDRDLECGYLMPKRSKFYK